MDYRILTNRNRPGCFPQLVGNTMVIFFSRPRIGGGGGRIAEAKKLIVSSIYRRGLLTPSLFFGMLIYYFLYTTQTHIVIIQSRFANKLTTGVLPILIRVAGQPKKKKKKRPTASEK